MVGALISRIVVVVFGTIYPAYASYKAVKSANVRQYVHWMMYWVVFALFITVETFTDTLISWLPMYYEVKVAFVLWLLSPYSRGSGFIYRKFIHPTLNKHEHEIDQFISSAKTQSYSTMVTVGTKGLNIAANAMATAALKSHEVVTDRLRSYSMNDLSRLPDNTPIHSQLQQENYVQSANPAQYQNPMMMQHQPRPPPRHNLVYPDQVVVHEPMQPLRAAASMGNLTMSPAPQNTNLGPSSDGFDSSPPATTVDDMNLQQFGITEDTSPYATLPRNRKKKKDKDGKSPSLRRSKRKGRPSKNYTDDGDDFSSH